MRVLKLTLKRAPFEVMITGEKRCVFLRPSKKMQDRLFSPDGSAVKYDLVEVRSGPKNRFQRPWEGTQRALISHYKKYSNGHESRVEKGDVSILLGRVSV